MPVEKGSDAAQVALLQHCWDVSSTEAMRLTGHFPHMHPSLARLAAIRAPTSSASFNSCSGTHSADSNADREDLHYRIRGVADGCFVFGIENCNVERWKVTSTQRLNLSTAQSRISESSAGGAAVTGTSTVADKSQHVVLSLLKVPVSIGGVLTRRQASDWSRVTALSTLDIACSACEFDIVNDDVALTLEVIYLISDLLWSRGLSRSKIAEEGHVDSQGVRGKEKEESLLSQRPEEQTSQLFQRLTV